MASRILVIGANGYIGRHIVKKLISLGHDVIVSGRQLQSIDGISGYISLDMRDLTAVRSLVTNCDFIFMLAGLTGTVSGFEKYREFIETNEIGLLNILEVLRGLNSKAKVIFPSSRLIYKGDNDSLKENSPKEFKTIYAVSKFAGETYLQMYGHYFDLRYSIFRICVPYGSLLGNDLSFGTVGHFVKQAWQTKRIRIYGDGSQRRSLIHIDDLTNILIAGGLSTATDNCIFNVGGPEVLSVREIADSIADIYGATVFFEPWPVLDAKIESGDTVFDSSEITSLLKYEYRYSFRDWAINEKLSI